MWERSLVHSPRRVNDRLILVAVVFFIIGEVCG